MKVKLKNGRIGYIQRDAGEYRVVVIPAEGNECCRTGAKAIIQTVHYSKLSEAE